MDDFSFSVFPNENFLDLRLFQFGWEQCAPLHSFGPFVRNHFLFHYVISGRGYLDADDAKGVTRRYNLRPGQGFLICPGLVNTYFADQHDPWKYVWLEFDGLRAPQYLNAAGLSAAQPIYQSKTPALAKPVEEVADACKLNRSYFSKLFKESMGCPPQEFLIRLRLSKAADQMKSSKAPIGEIAAACGYPNQLHFSRAFKKRYGVPPREWRIQNKGRD